MIELSNGGNEKLRRLRYIVQFCSYVSLLLILTNINNTAVNIHVNWNWNWNWNRNIGIILYESLH